MGLIATLDRYAVTRAHVLIVEVPGNWLGRIRLDAKIAERGWQLALTPADADVLAMCGGPDGELDELVARLWEQMPGPRVRIDVTADQPDAQVALEAAALALRDSYRHREDAKNRPSLPSLCGGEDGDMDHGDMDHGDMDHGDMDHGDMDHGDMDHGDMEMAPDGIALAEGARGRDGLEMDVLHIRLGPFLPHWPAGLVIDATLQGDVITEATGRVIGISGTPDASLARAWSEGLSDRDLDQVWRWDNLAHLLTLVGWQDAALRAQACRNAALTATDFGHIDERAAALARRIARSRSLRWSLRGVGPLSAGACARLGLPVSLAGDSYERLMVMVERVSQGRSADSIAPREQVAPDMAAVPSVLVGVDLAVARVVLATLDLRPEWVAAQGARDG